MKKIIVVRDSEEEEEFLNENDNLVWFNRVFEIGDAMRINSNNNGYDENDGLFVKMIAELSSYSYQYHDDDSYNNNCKRKRPYMIDGFKEKMFNQCNGTLSSIFTKTKSVSNQYKIAFLDVLVSHLDVDREYIWSILISERHSSDILTREMFVEDCEYIKHIFLKKSAIEWITTLNELHIERIVKHKRVITGKKYPTKLLKQCRYLASLYCEEGEKLFKIWQFPFDFSNLDDDDDEDVDENDENDIIKSIEAAVSKEQKKFNDDANVEELYSLYSNMEIKEKKLFDILERIAINIATDDDDDDDDNDDNNNLSDIQKAINNCIEQISLFKNQIGIQIAKIHAQNCHFLLSDLERINWEEHQFFQNSKRCSYGIQMTVGYLFKISEYSTEYVPLIQKKNIFLNVLSSVLNHLSKKYSTIIVSRCQNQHLINDLLVLIHSILYISKRIDAEIASSMLMKIIMAIYVINTIPFPILFENLQKINNNDKNNNNSNDKRYNSIEMMNEITSMSGYDEFKSIFQDERIILTAEALLKIGEFPSNTITKSSITTIDNKLRVIWNSLFTNVVQILNEEKEIKLLLKILNCQRYELAKIDHPKLDNEESQKILPIMINLLKQMETQ